MKKRYAYNKRVGQAEKLRPKKGKNISDYKTLDGYLNSVWKNNQGYLQDSIEKFNDPRTKKTIWKDKVKEYMKEINPRTGKPYTVKQAIDTVQRSELVTTAERRRSEVSFSRIREQDPETFKKIRKKIGWKNKFNINNVVDSWTEGKVNYYRYKDDATGKDIIIQEEISPKSGYVHTEVKDYDIWKEQTLKYKADKGDVQAAAEYAVQAALNRGRGK